MATSNIPLSGPCEICQTETKKHCALCPSTFYCSKEHQKEHWVIHKRTCPGNKKDLSEQSSKPADKGSSMKKSPPPHSWAAGLSGQSRYEWFVDSYRLRLDDDYLWGECYLHGLYAEDSTPRSIMIDFLVFCKMAVKHNVIPTSPPWKWNELLKVAGGILNFAFEKSDAREKYGGENVFTGALLSGRSLRFTSGHVYGYLHGAEDDKAMGVVDEIEKTVKTEVRSCKRKAGKVCSESSFFNDVGGAEIWHNLVEQLNK